MWGCLAGLYMLSALHDIGPKQREAYQALLLACNAISSKSFTQLQLQEARGKLLLAVCLVEACLPAVECDIKLHALTHLADKVERTCPLWTACMFIYEAMWCTFARFSINTANPELSMLRSFADYELAYLQYWLDPDSCSLSGIRKLDAELEEAKAHLYQVHRTPASLDAAVLVPQQALYSANMSGALTLALHCYYETYHAQ